MYLLPVTTFTDYLLAGTKWTAWTGGTLLLSFFLRNFQSQSAAQPSTTGQEQVQIKFDDVTRVFNTQHADPYAILRQARVGLGQNDLVSTRGRQIEVVPVEEKLIIEDSELSYHTQEKLSKNLAPGTSKIITRGQKGVKRQVIKLTLIAGKEVAKEVVDAEVINKPVDQVVLSNPNQVILSRSMDNQAVTQKGAWTQGRKTMVMTATAYTFTGNNTATGVPPRVGMVAVDPSVIPLGTELYIEGYGTAVAADTGGAIKGYKLDLFFNTVHDCMVWGRRKVKVYILKS